MFLFCVGSLCVAQLYWIVLCGETSAVLFVFLSIWHTCRHLFSVY